MVSEQYHTQYTSVRQDPGSIYCLHAVQPSRDTAHVTEGLKTVLLLSRFDGIDCIRFKHENGPEITEELV